jgi:plasmid stability protein
MADRLRRSYHAGMPAITIRNVPDDIRDELAARAARSGRSLQEYLAALLAETAARPDMATAIAAARDRVRTTGRVLDPEQIIADRDADRE